MEIGTAKAFVASWSVYVNADTPVKRFLKNTLLIVYIRYWKHAPTTAKTTNRTKPYNREPP